MAWKVTLKRKINHHILDKAIVRKLSMPKFSKMYAWEKKGDVHVIVT
jgi:hypothetical protein